MATRTYSSFEAMFAAHLHADLRGMVLGRDSKPWARTQLVPNTLSLQWGHPGGWRRDAGIYTASRHQILSPHAESLRVFGERASIG